MSSGIRVADLELEIRVDRAQRMVVEDPPGATLPAVVLRMPPYRAAELAHLLDRWAAVCVTAGGCVPEWVLAAHALLDVARAAVPGASYPELADLLHSPAHDVLPDGWVGPA
ncbi:hypothetical protein [Pseudofrankia sp. DC12]|uniref:hypothetical protein n=1 Tax=Pseudofrankia sp. DC12 TaxID=683315 RepID=UPI0005F7AE99|nr:hypothetical protein [Pseudofrankia sp. DC12]